MFDAVDHPMLVQGPRGEWIEVHCDRLTKVAGIGPEGWAAAADVILAAQSQEEPPSRS
jgi:hypothetical protein